MKGFILTSVITGALMTNASYSEAALGDQILRKGMVHSDVIELQEKLNIKSYYNYSIDGIYGPITAQAVRDFQRNNSLIVDGIVGPQTVSALKEKRIDAPVTMIKSAVASADSSVILRQGDRGKHVSELQKMLQAHGYYNYSIDGIFGPITEQAVRNFQQQKNIQVDGIVGAQTFRVLKAAASNNTSTSNNSEKGSSFNINNLINDAKSLLGSPYVWGGTTPSGFDSSGFITYVFNKNGVSLPRTHSEYWKLGIAVSQPKKGDIVFFETYKTGPSHAGIYLGGGEFIHNSSSQGVIISRMDNPYWNPRFIGAKRYS
ncbi:hypothetical protein BKP45_10565 [Anaerobacillus alkalidiazotrophicus]|uniref:NlpC/P60 domain-containing protein n=1 Tax=Anaerobacillus alkalidiazotrophicus TaxID=472963 RepID=A0A1S2M868_9BACI|nr:hypothetical protein BKP45_16280 [Anaerobacillus alkalidiazotrophicus]OIJ20007.1 hypothetical protein BKP45_10565 [Anaerobacillus alkalidiazotrophicus]